jgi:hypothetical protein
MKKKMRDMQGFNQPGNFEQKQNQQAQPQSPKPSKSDYIDYEEIK